MEIGTIPTEFKIELDGVSFYFAPTAQQDLVFASQLVDYARMTEAKVSPIDKDTALRHVFSKLQRIEGDITSNGEVLTVERVKEIGTRFKAKFTSALGFAWAIQVMSDLGFLDNEKKSETTASPAS